jgi:hypothetical protein
MPSKLRLILLDFIILCFQVILIFTSSSLTSALLQRATTNTTNAANTANDTNSSNHERIEEEAVDSQDPPIGYEHELVVEVNLRASIRNVLYAEMDIAQLREQRERTLLV